MPIEDLVTIKRSKRARRVALRLDPVERVINLVVPDKMPLHKAYSFAQGHEDWVRETLGKLAPSIVFKTGTILPIFGDHVTLCIENNPDQKRIKIKKENDIIKITTDHTDPTNRIRAYLKRLAREGLADMASEKAESLGKTISSVTVRDTKSRWGSCAQDGSLSFSWRLIFAPYAAIDYVVAHEVAHLVHMDHSRAFWTLCRDLSHDFMEGKYWMQNHGNELMRYGSREEEI